MSLFPDEWFENAKKRAKERSMAEKVARPKGQKCSNCKHMIRHPYTITALLKAAAAHTGIEARKIHSFRSLYAADRPILIARSALMLVMREDLRMTVTEIARAFGASSDPTRHAIRRAKTRDDEEFLALVRHLRDTLSNTETTR